MKYLSRKLRFAKKIRQDFQKKIRQLDEFKGFWKGHLNISPQILHRLKKFTLITSTGASTRIEGSYLSDADVTKLLTGIKIQKLKDRSQQEVAGYAELTTLIFENHKKIQLSESSITHLHKILLQYSQKDIHHRGSYKKNSNAVVARDPEGNETVIFNPTSPYLTPKEMGELVTFTRQHLETKEIHPLFIIGNFIGEFLAIHPFQDGNGRLSRALTNLLLLQEGYSYAQYVSLEKIIEERKEGYYLALRQSQKNRKDRKHNITPWVQFFLDTLIQQTKHAKAILDRKNIEEELSENQLTILRHLQTSEKAIAIKELVETTNINRNTARKALERLRDLRLAKQIGLGRATKWKAQRKK